MLRCQRGVPAEGSWDKELMKLTGLWHSLWIEMQTKVPIHKCTQSTTMLLAALFLSSATIHVILDCLSFFQHMLFLYVLMHMHRE